MQTIKIRPELTAIHRKNISVPLQTILNNLKEEDIILDYGCGHGYDLNFLKKNGWNRYDLEDCSFLFSFLRYLES